MARERDHFVAARTALAGYAAAGRFGWGRPLVATSLATELGLSPTPVREALAHLAGEGIIEHRPGWGYFAPSPTASDIVGLYQLHRQFLSRSASDAIFADSPTPDADTDEIAEIEGVFDRLAKQAGNDAALGAFRRVTTQLRPIRRIEASLQDTGWEIVVEINRLASTGLFAETAEVIEHYHQSRIELSPSLEKVMRQTA